MTVAYIRFLWKQLNNPARHWTHPELWSKASAVYSLPLHLQTKSTAPLQSSSCFKNRVLTSARRSASIQTNLCCSYFSSNAAQYFSWVSVFDCLNSERRMCRRSRWHHRCCCCCSDSFSTATANIWGNQLNRVTWRLRNNIKEQSVCVCDKPNHSWKSPVMYKPNFSITKTVTVFCVGAHSSHNCAALQRQTLESHCVSVQSASL